MFCENRGKFLSAFLKQAWRYLSQEIAPQGPCRRKSFFCCLWCGLGVSCVGRKTSSRVCPSHSPECDPYGTLQPQPGDNHSVALLTQKPKPPRSLPLVGVSTQMWCFLWKPHVAWRPPAPAIPGSRLCLWHHCWPPAPLWALDGSLLLVQTTTDQLWPRQTSELLCFLWGWL